MTENAHPNGVVLTGDDQDQVGTTVVCLDCGTEQAAVVTTYLRKSGADAFVRAHLAANAEHRTVTVPGWPMRRDAVALARVHVEATRIGRPGDDQCTTQLSGGEQCSCRAGHLGGCE